LPQILSETNAPFISQRLWYWINSKYSNLN
jgi:hypothetical protein